MASIISSVNRNVLNRAFSCQRCHFFSKSRLCYCPILLCLLWKYCGDTSKRVKKQRSEFRVFTHSYFTGDRKEITSEMEEILKQRIVLRQDNLSKHLVSSRNEFYNEEMDVDRAKVVTQLLKQAVSKLDEEIKEYTNKLSRPDPDVTKTAIEIQIQAEDLVCQIDTSLSNTVHATNQATRLSSTKLPKLELKTFTGDRLRWSEFWDRFQSAVHDKNISEADKLSYLLNCLQGEAADAVAGLTVTNGNYKVAIDALHRRYGSNEVLIDAHYTALNNLAKANNTSVSCRSTLDAIERHLRVLKNLGEPENGNHLRAVILAKFPEQTLHEYHLTADDDSSVASLRKGLNRIVMAMEKSTATIIPNATLPAQTTSETGATTEALHFRTETRSQVHNGPLKRKRKTNPSGEPPKKKTKLPCIFCNMKNHLSVECRRVKTIEARKQKLTGRCLRCLRRNHVTEECRRKISCFRCKGNHLQMLCPQTSQGEYITNSTTSQSIETICETSHGHTFLQTAVAKIRSPDNNDEQDIRLLLDSGSQRSYITRKAANKLKLSPSGEDLLLIYRFGATEPQEIVSPSVQIILKTKRGIMRKICVNIVPHITNRVPVTKLKSDNLDLIADDTTSGESIDLLLGNDVYCSLMRSDKIQIDNNLFLIDTDFGWILSGRDEREDTSNVLSVTNYCQCHTPNCQYFTEPDLPLRTLDLKFLWSLESIGITDSPKATRQEEAIKQFNESVQYRNGRYEVKWPWIQYPPELPSNFGIAIGRLKSLLKRLNRDSLCEYDAILKEQLDLGIIEVVDLQSERQAEHPIHYLPHHMVKQDGKKGRLVYDASAKTTGQKSLNECLYSGPSMLEDLTALLLKFRTKRIGLSADVEKAFLQVALQEEDRDVTRFLWIKNINQELTDDNLLCLRFRRVPFGAISSPFLLTATIRHHISTSHTDLIVPIANKCYVDNLVTGADSVQEATNIYNQARTTFEELSMNIRDWISNNEEVLQIIPEKYKAKTKEVVKILGLSWDVTSDTLALRITQDHCKTLVRCTKREVLRILSRVYDPCGFACPLILPMKLLFQKICERKVKWDSELPQDLVVSHKAIIHGLKAISEIVVPRYIGINAPVGNTTYELHCFTDASKNAYAAVVYLKAKQDQNTLVSFLIAKSHVSRTEDKEDLKIPRLELLGFLIGSRLLEYVKNNLNLPIEKEYLWTDSLVVLAWMKSNRLLPPFVTNRVNEIKRNHQQTTMCYVSTKFNPADVATRPELWEEKRDLWFRGPEFLQQEESQWPDNHHYNAHKTLLSFGEALGREPEGPDTQESGQPHFQESLGVEGVDNETHVSIDTTDASPEESTNKIKILQRHYFPEETTNKKTHLGRNLDLFLDVEGVLRCRGRMANTTWSYEMKYPILLPKDCEYTNNIIKQTHERNYHVGAAHTLSKIRERYWIPQGKAQVQKVLRRCSQCVKHGGGPYKLPATLALPPERVNYSEPFSFTGLDYFGPLYVSTESGREKRWIALFTCLTVRAIHLEVVKDLTAEECLLALRRFAAIRGVPKRMYSDNATCFKLTSEVLAKPYCIENKIHWKFIPQLAPWHGGFYERLVALVKHCFKRTLEKHLLNDSKLQTVMKEVEAVVNSRPLTQVGTELVHILRPADFLSLGKCLMMEPSSIELPRMGTISKTELIDSWKKGLKILEEFKKMFVSQYLAGLRERFQQTPKQPRIRSSRTPKTGDIVQIKSDAKNRENWKIGKIVALIKGNDGECRVAKVNVGDTTLTRSIGHLYPLEVDSDEQPQVESCAEREPEHYGAPIEVPEEHMEVDLSREVSPENQHGLELETQPHSDTGTHTEAPTPMEIPPNTEGEGTDEQPNLECPLDTGTPDLDDMTTPDVPQPQNGDQGRGRRDAAIRARAKILEWTRHLLILLQ